LINNAGIGGNVLFKKNSLDYDLIAVTNHIGHFLLTILLLPFIDERIINVSSEVHDPAGEHYLPDPQSGWPTLSPATSAEEYDNVICKGLVTEGDNDYKAGIRRYTRSKLCNVFFTHELARRLSKAVPKYIEKEEVLTTYETLPKDYCDLPQAKEIKVISFNPGLMLDTMFVTNSINSTWVANTLWFLSPGIKNLLPAGNLMRDSRTSGERMAKLAFGAIENQATAAFFSDEKSKPSSRFSRSIEGVQHQVELWNNSIRWAKITDDELIEAGLKKVNPKPITTPSKSEKPTLIGLVGALPNALGI
jgi:NAD(P)-dependent dehydrogenase (short-subunit alcohol dehydrogenase family)